MKQFSRSKYYRLFLFCLAFVIFIPTIVGADNIKDNPLDGLESLIKVGETKEKPKKAGVLASLKKVTNIPTAIGNIIGAVLSFVGVLFFILTIYAGILWMTAGGNDERFKKAFGILTSATIGLVIIMASSVIIGFVFGFVGGG